MNIFASKAPAIRPAPGVPLPPSRIERDERLQRCATTLLSNELRDLLVRTIDAWVDVFDEARRLELVQFKMGLVLEQNQMQFDPSYKQLETLILGVVDRIASTLQDMNQVHIWLSGSGASVLIPASVGQHIIDEVCELDEFIVRSSYFSSTHTHANTHAHTHLIELPIGQA